MLLIVTSLNPFQDSIHSKRFQPNREMFHFLVEKCVKAKNTPTSNDTQIIKSSFQTNPSNHKI